LVTKGLKVVTLALSLLLTFLPEEGTVIYVCIFTYLCMCAYVCQIFCYLPDPHFNQM